MKNDAAKTYAARAAAIRAELARIEAELAEHEARQSKRPEDWGFVGDLGSILERLSDITH